MANHRRVAAALLAVVAAAALTGCGAQRQDLEDVTIKQPDKYELYVNIDTHPNVARFCIGGVAFASTSREYTSVMRIPEWDEWCKS